MPLARPRGPARREFTPRFAKPVGTFCDQCALEHLGAGFVPATGAPSRIHLLGEAPGYDESAQGVPFIGAAGSMLTRILQLAGHTREEYRIDNTVRCVPPDFNIARFPTAVAQCRYRESTLDELPPGGVIVTLGGTATKAALGYAPDMKGFSIEHFHGTVHRHPTRDAWVVPTFHPSYLQRGAVNLMGVCAFDLQRAHEVEREGWAADPAALVIDPPLDWFAAWADSYLAAAVSDPYAYPLAVDIETPEKGADESGLVSSVNDATYQITQVNLSCHPDEGVTVPGDPAYLAIVARIIAAEAVKYFWYKGYDYPRLTANGCPMANLWCYDLMWAAKALQSDLPMNLGFWAPFYSRWGAWKHLAKGPDAQPKRYAAIDGFQTRRVGDGIVGDLVKEGRWDVFARQMHRYHAVVLQPATDIGLPIDRPRLEQLNVRLDAEAHRLLDLMAAHVPEALCPLTPKAGLTRPPAADAVHTHARATTIKGAPKKDAPDPLKMALYARAHVVEKLVVRSVKVCKTCGAVDVQARHRCQPALPGVERDAAPNVVTDVASVMRWFWQEPFNPDSPQQMLAYALAKKHQPGRSKTTGNAAMDRDTLNRLLRETGDVLYEYALAYRAVAKVRGTYVLATLRQMDGEDRLHGSFGFKPSTMRLNGANPNLQNVVADKGGKDSLAAGFRKVIVARGRWVPAGCGWEDEDGVGEIAQAVSVPVVSETAATAEVVDGADAGDPRRDQAPARDVACVVCGAPDATPQKTLLNGLPHGLLACETCRQAVKDRQVGVVQDADGTLHVTDGREVARV